MSTSRKRSSVWIPIVPHDEDNDPPLIVAPPLAPVTSHAVIPGVDMDGWFTEAPRPGQRLELALEVGTRKCSCGCSTFIDVLSYPQHSHSGLLFTAGMFHTTPPPTPIHSLQCFIRVSSIHSRFSKCGTRHRFGTGWCHSKDDPWIFVWQSSLRNDGAFATVLREY